MLKTTLIIGLIATVALVLAQRAMNRGRVAAGGGACGLATGLPCACLARAAYAVLGLCVAALALTSFFPLLVQDRPMGGLLLMTHTGAGLGLAWALAVVLVLRAGANRFSPADAGAGCAGRPRKAWFWLMALAGLVALASILASMLSWFGTDGQRTLIATHRYAGIAMLVATAGHLNLLGCAARRDRAEDAGKG